MPTNDSSTATGTVQFHRVLKAPAERVYRAFVDAAALSKWLPPNGFTCTVHSLEAKVGGSYRMSFTNFTTGESHSFDGTYLELVPHERIRYSDKFEDPNLAGEMFTTIVLNPVSCGTEIRITQEGLPAVMSVHDCYLGWQDSLVLLGKLVETEVRE